MDKEDLMRVLSRRTPFTKASAGVILEKFVEVILDGLAKDKRVVVANLGVFKIMKRHGATIRIPSTGKTQTFPDRLRLKFAPHRNLRRF